MEEELLICNASGRPNDFCKGCSHSVLHKMRPARYIAGITIKDCSHEEYCECVLCKCVPVKGEK